MNSPDYLKGKTHTPQGDSPSRLLSDGQWRGHGEPQYEVFDIWNENEHLFQVRLPVPYDKDVNAPVVTVEPESGSGFVVYDARQHPSNMYHPDNHPGVTLSRMQVDFRCPECGKGKFQVAVGFEIPGDSISQNDISWFALAVRCAHCHWEGIAYDDETA